MGNKHTIRIVVLILIAQNVTNNLKAQLFSKTDSITKNGYELHGYIGGLKEGEKVTMLLGHSGVEDLGNYSDSAVVKNGEFHIKGIVRKGPRQYFLLFHSKMVRLLIDNEQNITIRINDINRIKAQHIDQLITIEGSPTNNAKDIIYHTINNYSQSIYSINGYLRRIQDSIGFDRSSVESALRCRKFLNEVLYSTVTHNAQQNYKDAIPFYFQTVYGPLNHDDILVRQYNELSDEQKQSFYGKLMFQDAMLGIGQSFPEFKLPSLNGDSLALRDVISKSKLTLVHFWSTNSINRTRYQDELLHLYKKYNKEGLNIIGLSADTSYKAWIDYINRFKLPWYNVSDLKGENGVVEKVYHIFKDYPYMPDTVNVLIDSNGKILAWGATGVELKWYLWKAFAK
jgi:peroxiredoxin